MTCRRLQGLLWVQFNTQRYTLTRSNSIVRLRTGERTARGQPTKTKLTLMYGCRTCVCRQKQFLSYINNKFRCTHNRLKTRDRQVCVSGLIKNARRFEKKNSNELVAEVNMRMQSRRAKRILCLCEIAARGSERERSVRRARAQRSKTSRRRDEGANARDRRDQSIGVKYIIL